jgi:hypothetical protein
MTAEELPDLKHRAISQLELDDIKCEAHGASCDCRFANLSSACCNSSAMLIAYEYKTGVLVFRCAKCQSFVVAVKVAD